MSLLAPVQRVYTRYRAIADDTLYLGDALPRAIAGWFLRRTGRRVRPAVAGESQTDLLDQRGEQVALAFDAIGARPRRLDNVEIAELLLSCWCPERTRRQPLRIQRRAALVVENLPAAGLAVTGLPRTIVPGWLRGVCDQGLPFDLAVHIRRIP